MSTEKKSQLNEEPKVKKIGDQARVVDAGSPKLKNPSEADGQNGNIICADAG